MESWERQLNQVQVPDPIIPSHRDGLRKKLQSGRIPGNHIGRTLATLSISTLVALGALTVSYPSWAKDLWNTTLVQTITFQTKDGHTVMIKKIDSDQCSTACDPAACKPANCDTSACRMVIIEANERRTIGFDAAIEGVGMAGGESKTFTISTPDCDQTWIVNGDTIDTKTMVMSTEEWPDVSTDSESEDEESRSLQTSEDSPGVSSDFQLLQNYPNPFNPTTQIPFSLNKAGHVTLKVYNLTGQEVATLMDGEMTAGNHTVTFDGAGLPTGTYLYLLSANGSKQVKTMMLTK